MSRIICYNRDGDEVHVIERVLESLVEAIFSDLVCDGYHTIIIITPEGREMMWVDKNA